MYVCVYVYVCVVCMYIYVGVPEAEGNEGAQVECSTPKVSRSLRRVLSLSRRRDIFGRDWRVVEDKEEEEEEPLCFFLLLCK